MLTPPFIGGMLGGPELLIILFMLLIPAAVLILVVLGGLKLLGGRTSDPAMESLRIAYARGDLSEEEYENRRRKLERDRG
jgi:putative membrane protein